MPADRKNSVTQPQRVLPHHLGAEHFAVVAHDPHGAAQAAIVQRLALAADGETRALGLQRHLLVALHQPTLAHAVLGQHHIAAEVAAGLASDDLRGSAKLPLALFFGINAALLCALSVVFAGHGVKALQEAGIFGTRPVAFFDFDWLGIHADAYSLSAQAVAILAIVVLYGRSRLAEKRRVAA